VAAIGPGSGAAGAPGQHEVAHAAVPVSRVPQRDRDAGAEQRMQADVAGAEPQRSGQQVDLGAGDCGAHGLRYTDGAIPVSRPRSEMLSECPTISQPPGRSRVTSCSATWRLMSCGK